MKTRSCRSRISDPVRVGFMYVYNPAKYRMIGEWGEDLPVRSVPSSQCPVEQNGASRHICTHLRDPDRFARSRSHDSGECRSVRITFHEMRGREHAAGCTVSCVRYRMTCFHTPTRLLCFSPPRAGGEEGEGDLNDSTKSRFSGR